MVNFSENPMGALRKVFDSNLLSQFTSIEGKEKKNFMKVSRLVSKEY
jgi:hypothetical protein